VATYEPFGPLKNLALGNGLTETRSFDPRYAPSAIRVDGTGPLLDWSYTTDFVGNITGIADLLNAANNRTYTYQDFHYFLTQGNGPWGPRSWTYDRIGNRLTETRGAATDTYTYLINGTGGRTPKIATITRGGSTFSYGYDAVGDIVSDGTQPFAYGDDRRMSEAGTPGSGTASGTALAYDGRGYLSQSIFELPGALHSDDTLPTYGSEGLLYHRFAHQSLNPYGSLNSVKDSELYVFYFAGRPVATLNRVAQGRPGALLTTSTWQYLTTDHLGTPIQATTPAGAETWEGGFEPFGGDYSSAATPLRFPGQWFDSTWNGNKDVGLYYNVHRWYGAGVGRYGQADPAWNPRYLGEVNHYAYAIDNPIRFTDFLGLAVERCCRPSHLPLIGGAVLHCWVKTSTWQAGQQQNPNDPSRCPFFNSTVIADHSSERGADVRCEPVQDVDEKCVDHFLSENMGAPLGSFPQQTCHGFVNELFRRCRSPHCKYFMEIPPAAGWSLQ
jgi:RHS repeat-associated protein